MERFSQFNMDEALMLWEIGATTVMALLLAVALVFLFVAIRKESNSKTGKRIKNLRKRAGQDPYAKKELERILRKKKNKEKRIKLERRGEIALAIVLSAVFIVVTAVWVAPAWYDYITKDYVVYDGEYEVDGDMKRGWVTLPDGTTLRCRASEQYDEHKAPLLYSRHSKFVVGWQD